MAWYRTGTVTMTNGSATVVGAGTDFVSNAQIGQGFIGPNGLTLEIANIVSATQLTLVEPYQGPSGAGQAYKIQPTSSFARDLALQFAGFKNTFGGILDTIGQGMFGDGTVAAPGIRFAADQDSGLRRVGENALALVTAGTDRLVVSSTGNVGVGKAPQAFGSVRNLHVYGGSGAILSVEGSDIFAQILCEAGIAYFGSRTSHAVGFTTNAAERMRISPEGAVGIGTTLPQVKLHVSGVGVSEARVRITNPVAGKFYDLCCGTPGVAEQGFAIYDGAAAVNRLVITEEGNLLVGASTGSSHRIVKAVAQGARILEIFSTTTGVGTAQFLGASSSFANGAACALDVGKNTDTGRGINSTGTGNFNGSDYAEYIRKAANCGTILKGDVCGIDRNGELVRTWSDAVRYVVKSTDPSLVGGDTWAGHLPPKPEAPGAAPVMPTAPIAPAPLPASPIAPVREDGETDEAFMPRAADFFAACLTYETLASEHTAYQEALAAYPELLAAHQTAYAAWQADVDAYDVDLHTWEGQLETARQCVDRIAFSGQVPVNVDDATLAACEAALADGVAVYLVAVARGAGIGVVAVREADMTLAEYMKRVGVVWAIREGRPWIDVQHG